MQEGRLLVIGGQLPHDAVGHRVGKPDVLLRVTDLGEKPGYVPVDVKHYQQFGDALKRTPRKESLARISTLDDPAVVRDAPQVSATSPSRFKAALQLAHYTRMLEACGFHPGPDWLVGGVIGTSDLRSLVPGVDETVIGWTNLADPLFVSYSRTRQGPVKRSAMERYDHEFGFRVTVAEKARDAGLDMAPTLVEPIRQKECDTCPYQDRCWTNTIGRAHQDVTFETLSVREWKALSGLGVTTTADLASVDLEESDLLQRLVPEIEQTEKSARGRLERAVRRARLVVAGLPWECTAEQFDVPAADVEIDVDMENQEQGGLVYMWGVRRRTAQDDSTAAYLDDFHTWDPLDAEAASGLALRYFRWLQSQIRDAEAAGRTVLFFHWSHPEISKLRNHLAGTQVTDEEFNHVAEHHVDLERFFKDHFFTVHGTGLKVVAPALGFRWSSSDAGGEHSLGVVEEAQQGDDAARAWLLEYNEADTAATAHIRDALRTLDLTTFR
jgi:predicted RecB family nuclease